MPRVPPLAQIAPRWIPRNNQLNFLNPQPAFNPFLAVNRTPNIVKALVVNQSIDLVVLAELRSITKFMFPDPAVKIICDAHVQCLGMVGQNVNAIASAIAGVHRSFVSLRMTMFDSVHKKDGGVSDLCKANL
jgi:hypothetical protein